jgi:hypothetical protein
MENVRQKAIAAGLVTVLGTLASCSGSTLISDEVAVAIQEDIEVQGGVPVKSVVCPETQTIAVGETLTCEVELSQGGIFSVDVAPNEEQPPDQPTLLENLQWDVPHSQGLINLSKLEDLFQDEIAQEMGKSPTIDCGGIYRANQPGEFECQVENAIVPNKTKVEAIVVKLDPQGNVSWQQIRQDLVASAAPLPNRPTAAATPAPTATPTAANPAAPATGGSAPATSPAAPATSPAAEPEAAADTPPPAASGEDFLNQPGATDGFD